MIHHGRRLAGWLSVPCVVLCGSLYGGQAETAVGMILTSSGEVRLLRDGEVREAGLAVLLYGGDTISVRSGELSFLFCPSQERVTVGPGTTVKLSSRVETVAGNRLETEPARRCALPRVALGSASLERVGALRARGFPPVVVLLGGKIRQDRPTFRWVPLGEAESYALVLKDLSGREIWETETESTVAEFPRQRPPLDPGSYSWLLTARGKEGVVGEQRARFEVSPDPSLAQPPPATAADRLLLAAELENSGYFAEAAEIYAGFRQLPDAGDRLTRHLAWLYWEAGLIAAANAEKARLARNELR